MRPTGLRLLATVSPAKGSTSMQVPSGRSACRAWCAAPSGSAMRSEEHTSELQSLMRISYAVFCLKKTIEKTKRQSQPKLITTHDIDPNYQYYRVTHTTGTATQYTSLSTL